MRTLVVVLVLVAGWIVMALLLPVLIPGSGEIERSLRGAVFLAYILVAIIAIRRSRKGQRERQQRP